MTVTAASTQAAATERTTAPAGIRRALPAASRPTAG